MNIKDLIAKALKGEQLSDEEKKALESLDTDAIAAAARKSAEAKAKEKETKAAELEAKLAEALEKLESVGKSEAEKSKAEQEKAAKNFAKLQAQLETLTREKGEIVRGHKLEKIVSGLKIVPNVDRDLIAGMVKAKFASLKDEELDDESTVAPLLVNFRDANKALFLDESGHGSGAKRDGSNPAGGSGATDPSKQSDAERLTALRALDKS